MSSSVVRDRHLIIVIIVSPKGRKGCFFEYLLLYIIEMPYLIAISPCIFADIFVFSDEKHNNFVF